MFHEDCNDDVDEYKLSHQHEDNKEHRSDDGADRWRLILNCIQNTWTARLLIIDRWQGLVQYLSEIVARSDDGADAAVPYTVIWRIAIISQCILQSKVRCRPRWTIWSPVVTAINNVLIVGGTNNLFTTNCIWWVEMYRSLALPDKIHLVETWHWSEPCVAYE